MPSTFPAGMETGSLASATATREVTNGHIRFEVSMGGTHFSVEKVEQK